MQYGLIPGLKYVYLCGRCNALRKAKSKRWHNQSSNARATSRIS